MVSILVISLNHIAAAQSDSGQFVRLNQIGGTVKAMATGPNGILYIGDGVGLIAANVASDLTISPQTRTTFPGLVNNLIITGSVAYLALEDRSELYVLDLSVPLTPTVVIVMPFDNPISRLRHFDGRLYVVFHQSLSILDISTPLSPNQLGAFDLSSIDLSSVSDNWFVNDLAVLDNYAYLGGYFPPDLSLGQPSGFVVLDIANPLAPSFVMTKTITGLGSFGNQSLIPEHLALHGTDLLATAYSGGRIIFGRNILSVLDVSSLSAFEQSTYRPVVSLGETILKTPTIEAFVVQERYGYALSRNGELRIIDLESSSSPPEMTVVKTVPIDSNQPLLQVRIARSLTLFGGAAFVGTDEVGVIPLDVSSPLSPTIRPVFPLLGIVQDVAAQPSSEITNLVLTRPSAVSRVQMASSSDFAFTGKIDLYEPHSLHISGDRVYFAASAVYREDSHLQVMNLEASPEDLLVGEAPIGPIPALSAPGRWIYAADVAQEETDVAEYLQVLDADAGALPAVVASYPLNDVSVFLQVQGNFLYRITQGGNFEIFSLVDPVAPVLQGSVDLELDRGFVRSAVVQGEAAYVIRYSTSLIDVLDLRIPQSPTVVGELDVSMPPSALAADESTLFVAVDRTLYGFTQMQPLLPTFSFSKTVAAQIAAIDTLGGYLFLAEGDAGLSLYKEKNYHLHLPFVQTSE